ncbi:MAG: hypothetical protein ACHQHN_12955, partial [Sphingobacteriales bacterium]
IKFNTNILKENFKRIFHVTYCEEFPKIDFLTNFFESMSVVSLFKSTHWQYEKEIRIIESSKGLFEFNPKAIEELVFGIKATTPFDFLKDLKKLGYGKVKFTETTQNTSEYKIHYNRSFDFISKPNDQQDGMLTE